MKIRIDAERLWKSLMDLARIGATPKGGVRRITLTAADREGRDQFVRWARDAALAVRWDAIGNIFARRPGSHAGTSSAGTLPPDVEPHMQQGTVPEDTRTTIGVVNGAPGQRWFDAASTGQDSHAGPTPRELRTDALIAASRLVLEVNRIAKAY